MEDLKSKTIEELLELRRKLWREGHHDEAAEITQELLSRGYNDPATMICKCWLWVGDNPACPVHGGQP